MGLAKRCPLLFKPPSRVAFVFVRTVALTHAITLMLSARLFLFILRSLLKALAGLLDAAAEVSAKARKLVDEWEEWRILLKRKNASLKLR